MFSAVPVSPDSFKACIAELREQVSDPTVGLYGPDSLMWEINHYSAPYMLATTQAAFLDVAHPWIAAGVAHHSTIFTDPRMRARKTYNMLTTVVYGDLPSVLRAARAVHSLHQRVEGSVAAERGTFADPTRYAANELNALTWVHAASWLTRLGLYERVVRPLTDEERDRFWQETKRYALCFGIPGDHLPATWHDFEAYVDRMLTSGELAPCADSRHIMAFLERQIPPGARERLLAFNSLCLPEEVREILGLPEDSAATRRRYRQVLGSLKASTRLPGPISELPPYRAALARIEGRERPDVVTRGMAVVLGGRPSSRKPRATN